MFDIIPVKELDIRMKMVDNVAEIVHAKASILLYRLVFSLVGIQGAYCKPRRQGILNCILSMLIRVQDSVEW